MFIIACLIFCLLFHFHQEGRNLVCLDHHISGNLHSACSSVSVVQWALRFGEYNKAHTQKTKMKTQLATSHNQITLT